MIELTGDPCLKTFQCQCGNSLYFSNNHCLACDRKVGYLPDAKQLSALEPAADGRWLAFFNRQLYRRCQNDIEFDVCNWLVPADDQHAYCVSCRLNHIIPNLSNPENITLWYRIEQAKRRLLYTLFSLNLPVKNRTEDPQHGMGFEFMEDETAYDEFTNELTKKRSVITGHNAGIITINLLEAQPSKRVKMREQMNERYRTLLGHFRHESGHYYWERLINNTDNIHSFRELFGDERNNYQDAMKFYYDTGAMPDWQNHWISAYASSHPWEDWAETWAHYLHMVDTLETANSYGFRIHGYDVSAPSIDTQMSSGYMATSSFNQLIDDWYRLSTAHNALNRSMGMSDAYPFILSGMAVNKLRYTHQIVLAASQQ